MGALGLSFVVDKRFWLFEGKWGVFGACASSTLTGKQKIEGAETETTRFRAVE
jgi:hypothetical protein